MTKMKLIQVDLAKCSGCKLCEMACSFHFERECSISKSRIKILRDDEFGDHLVQFCTQCAEAPCIPACPTDAFYRDSKSGVVQWDEVKCNGCGVCLPACPVGALFMDRKKNIVFKCDLCGGDPECVKFCPPKALLFQEEELESPDRKAFFKQSSKHIADRLGGK
jgi:anaerobic carbon-monoxide dehydrogenase iron sulfur subunit